MGELTLKGFAKPADRIQRRRTDTFECVTIGRLVGRKYGTHNHPALPMLYYLLAGRTRVSSGRRLKLLLQPCFVPKLCPTRAHSSAFQRTPAHVAVGASLSVASSYAYLREPRPRSENPGVGGSIPSQPTILSSTCRTPRRDRSEPVCQVCDQLGHIPDHSSTQAAKDPRTKRPVTISNPFDGGLKTCGARSGSVWLHPCCASKRDRPFRESPSR